MTKTVTVSLGVTVLALRRLNLERRQADSVRVTLLSYRVTEPMATGST